MHKIESLLNLPKDWNKGLKKSNLSPDIDRPINHLKALGDDIILVYPPVDSIYNAFQLCTYSNTKVVILGQDPYHQKDVANGLAFAVSRGKKIPPSLRSIYKEISDDIGSIIYSSGDLEGWAKQGVLLLNSCLTVEDSKPRSHQSIGWGQLTDNIVKLLNLKGGIVFILWGADSISKRSLIDENINLVLTAPHPSPLSSYRGFFGCKHFSIANEYLSSKKQKPIQW
jgi:uracil-DNA glycosylase